MSVCNYGKQNKQQKVFIMYSFPCILVALYFSSKVCFVVYFPSRISLQESLMKTTKQVFELINTCYLSSQDLYASDRINLSLIGKYLTNIFNK